MLVTPNSDKWLKITFSLVVIATIFFSPSFCVASLAANNWDGNIAKLKYAEIKEDFQSVEIYLAPEKKGNPILRDSYDTYGFMVDPKPLVNKKDKSTWYQIILNFENYGRSIIQPQKHEEFKFSFPFINAKYVDLKTAPAEYIQAQLNDLQRGRPVKIKIGDIVNLEYSRYIFELTASVNAFQEPNDNAAMLSIPAGTRVLGEVDGVEGLTIPYYLDMNDVFWVGIVSEKEGKILGWLKNYGTFYELPQKEAGRTPNIY